MSSICSLPPGGFTVDTRTDSDVVVLALSGELDLSTTPVVREALADAEAEPLTKLVLDLAGLTFIDSMGLHVLVELHQRLLRRGTPELEIRGAGASVRRVFQIAGLERALPLV